MEQNENLLQDAMSMAQGDSETPEYIDDEFLEAVINDLSAWVFDSFTQLVSESDEALGVEEFAAFIPSAVGAAYIAGCLVTNRTRPVTVSKDGNILNFYFNS